MARQNTEGSGKGEASAAEAERPMERFKSLARKLVKVPRGELDDARRLHDAAQHEKQKRPP